MCIGRENGKEGLIPTNMVNLLPAYQTIDGK